MTIKENHKKVNNLSIIILLASILIGAILGEKGNFLIKRYLYNELFWGEKISGLIGIVVNIIIIIICVLLIWGLCYKLMLSPKKRIIEKNKIQ